MSNICTFFNLISFLQSHFKIVYASLYTKLQLPHCCRCKAANSAKYTKFCQILCYIHSLLLKLGAILTLLHYLYQCVYLLFSHSVGTGSKAFPSPYTSTLQLPLSLSLGVVSATTHRTYTLLKSAPLELLRSTYTSSHRVSNKLSVYS